MGAKSILLIEDNLGDQRLVQEYLRFCKNHYNCLVIGSLKEASDLLRRENFDCILLDLSLPDADGLEAISKIQAQQNQTPIIVLTGLDDTNIAQQAVALGAQDYLVKGCFEPSLLERSISYAAERKQLVNRLNEEIERRKQLDKIKDEFLNTVSHEMRTPLTVIKGNISNLAKGILGPFNEKQGRSLDTTSRNIDRLSRIINNLLDLARLGTHKVEAKLQSISSTKFFFENIQNFSTLAEDKNILLNYEISEQVPKMNGDSDMLTQVINNFMDNALRYAKEVIQVKIDYFSKGKFSKDHQRPFIQLCVADDGVGIPQEKLEKVFNKFEQVGRPQGGEGYKGTGLGLTICQEIARLHQSYIWVDSQVGQGSQFYFAVPTDLKI